MAIQPPQRFELDDLAHVEREARTIYAPGATPGDVLTVQSDHSLVAAPGGGSQPGAQHWIGPYTVGFADFDPDTFAAEVMTPLGGDLVLGGRFVVTDAPFDSGTLFKIAVGDLADGPVQYLGFSGVRVDGSFGPSGGAFLAVGPELGVTQNQDESVQTIYAAAAYIDPTAVGPRVYAYTNQLPTQGSALLWLCFATPEAP